MKLLKEIFHNEDIDIEGKAITRNAVRGIIIDRQQKLLMILSQKVGDYKFPGGGVNSYESYEKALVREVREESGAEIKRIEADFGKVVEYDIPIEQEFDVFKMTSHYYLCQVEKEFGKQKLDQYEEALGFRPCWVSVDEALQTNQALLRDNSQNIPHWIKREIFVLKQIEKELIGKARL
ncbi:MAG: NUDIX domain-containing protein [Anaerolineaceae bacterium]|nr:NUDIX domain-containing protein [Anaerolineaceae bacterium]